MLGKHRRLWKVVMTVLVLAMYAVMLCVNQGELNEGLLLKRCMSGFYILLLCAALFVFGKSRVLLVCISVYWGAACLSGLVMLFGYGAAVYVMFRVFLCVMLPFIGILTLPPWQNILLFIAAYALFWLAHRLGKYYERRKADG